MALTLFAIFHLACGALFFGVGGGFEGGKWYLLFLPYQMFLIILIFGLGTVQVKSKFCQQLKVIKCEFLDDRESWCSVSDASSGICDIWSASKQYHPYNQNGKFKVEYFMTILIVRT